MDEKKKSEERDGNGLGISKFLPRPAAERLVRAAIEAQALVPGSLKRRRVIDDAIQYVKLRWPERFNA